MFGLQRGTILRVGAGATRGDLRRIKSELTRGHAVTVIGRRRVLEAVAEKLSAIADVHGFFDPGDDEDRTADGEDRMYLWRGDRAPTFSYFTKAARRRRGESPSGPAPDPGGVGSPKAGPAS